MSLAGLQPVHHDTAGHLDSVDEHLPDRHRIRAISVNPLMET